MKNKKLTNFLIAKTCDILLLTILIIKSIINVIKRINHKNKKINYQKNTNWNHDFEKIDKKSPFFIAEIKFISFLLKIYPKEYIRKRKLREYVSDFSYEMF